jgi:glycosyltransferase involved in cell wall biosynthesis
LKRRLATGVDWWFAYTELSKDVLTGYGMQSTRITVVDNAIDTQSLSTEISNTSRDAVDQWRHRLDIDSASRVGIFCGGMHRGKRLSFVLDSCRRIRSQLPNFEAVFIGDGPDGELVERASRHAPWIHSVGPIHGPERATLFALGHVMLMPAHVGLAVIDSFVAQLPMITTTMEGHSPEICYLVDGFNGAVSRPTVDDYANTVVKYLTNNDRLRSLQAGCRESAKRYTLDNMVHRFTEGVERALGA